MASIGGPKIEKENLILNLDAANKKSYPGTGSFWYDISGNSNHGELINSVSYDESIGKRSLSFDGSNDYVLIPELNIEADWTVNTVVFREYENLKPFNLNLTDHTDGNKPGRFFLNTGIFRGVSDIQCDSNDNFYISTFGMGEFNNNFIPFVFKFDKDGNLDTNFNTGYSVGGAISSFIQVTSDDKLYIGGTNIDAFSNRSISDGSLINSLTGVNSNISNSFIIDELNNKAYHVGNYTIISGYSRKNMCKVDLETFTIDEDFDPLDGFDSRPSPIGFNQNGDIYYFGNFTSYRGQSVNQIALIDKDDASLITSFNVGTGFNDTNDMFIKSDPSTGKIYAIGRRFTTFNGQSVSKTIRINNDGTLDNTFNFPLNLLYTTRHIQILNDGKILLGSYQGVYKVNNDGTLDTSFNNGSSDSNFNQDAGNTFGSLTVLSDGKIILGFSSIVGGGSPEYKGYAFKSFIRLNTDGSVDESFNTNVGFTDSTTRYQFYFYPNNSENTSVQQVRDLGLSGRNSPDWWRDYMSYPRHLTFVKNNTNFKLYINGILRKNYDITSYGDFNLNINKILGGYTNVNSFRIWDKELTQEEITEDMNRFLLRYEIDEEDPIQENWSWNG